MRWSLLPLCLWLTSACDGSTDEAAAGASQSDPPATGAPAAAGPAGQSSRKTLEEIQGELDVPGLSKPWTGDLDGMADRRLIRVLTVYGLGRYFLDGPQERGIVYELFKQFEDHVNRQLGRSYADRIYLVIVPVARDELIPGLLSGLGDIAAAGLTITPERQLAVDFSKPVTKPIAEVLVTGPAAEPIGRIEDLAGQEIHVRASSSYRASLEAVNEEFRAAGLEPIRIQDISEFLEDEDLMEMVHSGLLPWAVVDDYKAVNLAPAFKNLRVRQDIVFREGGRIGYAFRQDSPKLKAMLDQFMDSRRQGTLQGNILFNRYVRDFDWADNVLAEQQLDRFRNLRDIFEKYGERYGVDYLMAAAQGYQESKLNQAARSPTGAIGVMQLLPSTAADPNVGIPDISDADSNIHAGVKYLSFIRERYFSDPEIEELDQLFFSLAAYNAGPARLAQLRSKAAAQGLDPNVWFQNVEVVAAREIGRETVQYVSNIAKYYVAYRLSAVRELQRADAVGAAKGDH